MEGVCRVCLAENRKTYRIANTALEQTYDVVTSVKLQRADRPTALCCVCVSQLRRCRRFIETARESNDALDRWYTNTGWKPTERPLFSFTRSNTKCIDIWEPPLKQEPTTETDDESQSEAGTYITVEIKREETCDDFQRDPLHVSNEQNYQTHTSYNKQYKTQILGYEQDEKQFSVELFDEKNECHAVESNITGITEDVKRVTLLNCVNVKDEKRHSLNDDYDDSLIDKIKVPKASHRSRKRIKLDQDSTEIVEDVKHVNLLNCVDVKNEKMQASNDVGLDNFKAFDQDIASTSHRTKKRNKVTQDSTLKRANINDEDKVAIVALHREGRNISQIAKETGFTRLTVRRWVKRFKEEGSLNSRMRTGRPNSIDQSLRRFMVNEYEQNGYIKPKHFAEVFDRSVATIRRTLRREGLLSKQFLLKRHKDERLRFARDYLDFNWETTVFSDERTFGLSKNGRLRSWQSNSTGLPNSKMMQKSDSGSITINIWAWMSSQGPGELVFTNILVNSDDYVDILNDTMLPTVRTVYPEGELPQINFVYDNNCPTQHSPKVQDWFSRQSAIKVIQWPTRSSDLNPFENVCDIMVQKWCARDVGCPEQLQSHILELWESLRGTDVCAGIVGSMRRRLQSCIDNNGGHVKY